MSKLQNLTCSCCGAELTKPQFFNGKMYGYTCITKVAGKGFKKSKIERVQVDLHKIVLTENTTRISNLKIKVADKVVNMGVFYAIPEEVIAGYIKTLNRGDLVMNEGKLYLDTKVYNKILNNTFKL